MTAASPPPQKPAELDALVALAERELNAGRLAEAAAAYRQIVLLRPDLAEAHNNLGNVLVGQRQLDEARVQYERATELNPALFQAFNNLANVLTEQGQLDEAVTRYEQALALKPDLAEAHKSLGNTLAQQGQLERAAAHYRQALVLNPNYAEAQYDHADLKTFHSGDVDLAALEAFAQTDGLPPGKMLYIHFALAKALEDVGDYERAFDHWSKGNAIKRREVEYNEAVQQGTFRLIADAFDAALLDRFRDVGDPSPVPIFVLGMPRSGSTLVEQILASHPQVQAAGELTTLDRLVRAVQDDAGRPMRFPAWVWEVDADTLRQIGEAYLASLPPLADGKQRITDKLPGNFNRVGLIRLILPNARIIHTTRDPVDTCVSCFARLFTTGNTFSYDLGELGRYCRGYHNLMAHWRSVLPAGAMLEVAYEDVVENLEEQARRLIDYCGLPWDDRCLNFHENSRPITTASNVQVRRPIYRSSLARWRRYEAFLGPLLAELDGCRP
ncbi:MAG TPA: sulfotransferase [Pirellulales bacterium]|jgi:tetratricopeptide (TPR) repeat protein